MDARFLGGGGWNRTPALTSMERRTPDSCRDLSSWTPPMGTPARRTRGEAGEAARRRVRTGWRVSASAEGEGGRRTVSALSERRERGRMEGLTSTVEVDDGDLASLDAVLAHEELLDLLLPHVARLAQDDEPALALPDLGLERGPDGVALAPGGPEVEVEDPLGPQRLALGPVRRHGRQVAVRVGDEEVDEGDELLRGREGEGGRLGDGRAREGRRGDRPRVGRVDVRAAPDARRARPVLQGVGRVWSEEREGQEGAGRGESSVQADRAGARGKATVPRAIRVFQLWISSDLSNARDMG